VFEDIEHSDDFEEMVESQCLNLAGDDGAVDSFASSGCALFEKLDPHDVAACAGSFQDTKHIAASAADL
jgi:hypothetical protein